MPSESIPESTPLSPQDPSTPDLEKLADSDDPAVISARADLLEAQAKLSKAQSSWWEKLVVRFILPIALAIVGPWAAWTFSVEAQAAREKAEEGIKEVGELRALLDQQREEMERRRVMFQRIEEDKAAELAAMSTIVNRLDSTLKLALIQMAVAQALAERGETSPPEREAVMRQVVEQVTLPEVPEDELKRIAGQSYDRILEQRTR
jgi:hypothetical protein